LSVSDNVVAHQKGCNFAVTRQSTFFDQHFHLTVKLLLRHVNFPSDVFQLRADNFLFALIENYDTSKRTINKAHSCLLSSDSVSTVLQQNVNESLVFNFVVQH
jgi:hypothetical protein